MELEEDINQIDHYTSSLSYIYLNLPQLKIQSKIEVETCNRIIYSKLNQVPTSMPLINSSDLQLIKSPHSYQQSTSPSIIQRVIPNISKQFAALNKHQNHHNTENEGAHEIETSKFPKQKLFNEQTSLEVSGDRDLEKELLIQSTLRSRKSIRMSKVKSVSPANSEEEENSSHQISYNSSQALQPRGRGILKQNSSMHNSQNSHRSSFNSNSQKKVRFSVEKSPFRDLLRDANQKYIADF